MTWRILIVLGVCAAGAYAFVSAASVPYAEARTIGVGVRSFEELSSRFQELAKKQGGEYAYEILRRATLPPGTDLHLLGHAVGDELYTQEGISGIAVCTQDFRNACSHSIVIGALQEFGPSEATVSTIREACAQAPGGSGAYTMCFHGLGHGVFAYYGYDLPAATALCKEFGTEPHFQEYTQCVGGIVMELMGGGGHDRPLWLEAREKYLDPSDPLAPCDTDLIPAEAKSYCYIYATPNLLAAAGAQLAAPDPSVFPRAFSFCDPITDTDLRDTCWGSFGKEFIPLAGSRDIRRVDQFSDDEYNTAISWCMLAPRPEAQEACISQAVRSIFWGGENDPTASLRFCSLVEREGARERCHRTLADDITLFLKGNEKDALCRQLPAAFQHLCMGATTS